jgi:hypothetical protein
MKKIFAIALVFVLALSLLTACGGTDNNSTPSSNGGDSTTTPPTSQGGNNTPSATPSETGGGDSNISVSDDSTPILDAIGKTEEGKRMVIQLVGESYSLKVAPAGTKALYHSYEFDADGVLQGDTSKYWYVFEDAASHNAALTKWLEDNPEFWLKNRSSSQLYYAVYVLAAVRDEDEDGEVTWDDAWFDWENWANHDMNVLIK